MLFAASDICRYLVIEKNKSFRLGKHFSWGKLNFYLKISEKKFPNVNTLLTSIVVDSMNVDDASDMGKGNLNPVISLFERYGYLIGYQAIMINSISNKNLVGFFEQRNYLIEDIDGAMIAPIAYKVL